MDDVQRDIARIRPSLTAAIRRARIEDAEQGEVVAELRGAEIARLEMLQDAIKPVLAQVPDDVDLFDVGLTPGEHPRLFIDMIGFVQMGRDRRVYRFLQDTRHGRVTITESDRIDTIVDAVTNYIARRLVEREKALAADGAAVQEASRTSGEKTAATEPAHATPAHATQAGDRATRRPRGWVRRFFALLFELVAAIAVAAALLAGAYFLYAYGIAWWVAGHGPLR